MGINNIEYNDLLNELLKKEEILIEINKKIEAVLNKRDNINQEYDRLISYKNDMREMEIKRNRKSIILGIIVIMIMGACSFFSISVLLAELIKVFKFLQLLLYLYYVVGGLFLVILQAYCFSSCYKLLSSKDDLCSVLVDSNEYKYLIEQINDREKEMKYLDMEYLSLANERDGLELEINSLIEKVSSSSNAVMFEDRIVKSVFNKGEQEVDGKKNNGPVRRRNMYEEMKKY